MTAAAVAPEPEPLECPDCGAPVAAWGVVLFSGERVPIEGKHILGDLLLTKVHDGWRVRTVNAGEHPDPLLRRRSHRCPVYSEKYPCTMASAGDNSPACGEAGRPYPDGFKCRRHERPQKERTGGGASH